jgi:hypothetical protein
MRAVINFRCLLVSFLVLVLAHTSAQVIFTKAGGGNILGDYQPAVTA